MANIIQEFIDAQCTIVDLKKKSLLPKLIKNTYYKEKAESLKNKINELTNGNTSIPIKAINDYGLILAQNFKPFGQHEHCRRAIKAGPDISVIIFEFKINNNENIVVSFNPSDKDGLKSNVNYSCISYGKPSLSFSDSDVEILIDSEKCVDAREENFQSVSEKVILIKDLTTRCIIEDITKYLDETFKQIGDI